jgi:hypothetical protein
VVKAAVVMNAVARAAAIIAAAIITGEGMTIPEVISEETSLRQIITMRINTSLVKSGLRSALFFWSVVQ